MLFKIILIFRLTMRHLFFCGFNIHNFICFYIVSIDYYDYLLLGAFFMLLFLLFFFYGSIVLNYRWKDIKVSINFFKVEFSKDVWLKFESKGSEKTKLILQWLLVWSLKEGFNNFWRNIWFHIKFSIWACTNSLESSRFSKSSCNTCCC